MGSGLHPQACNLLVCGSNLTGGSQPVKLPSFSGYSVETFQTLGSSPQKATKLALKLRAHLLQYAC